MNEVCIAVEIGYSLVYVYEFWRYSVTRFEKGNKCESLFAEYVNMLLKLKQGSSGSPPGFLVRTTKRNTLRTTGAQKELL